MEERVFRGKKEELYFDSRICFPGNGMNWMNELIGASANEG